MNIHYIQMANTGEQPSGQPAGQPELHAFVDAFEFEEQLPDGSSAGAGQFGLFAILLLEQQCDPGCFGLASVQHDAHSTAEHRR